jgi:hypothetical protein
MQNRGISLARIVHRNLFGPACQFIISDELTLVVENASGTPVNENYTWYDDGTLKTYPGLGYTRLLDYDEEGRLTSIKRDNGTTQTLAYEYAYGFDGGRRWRKDYDNNIWNWYPCGVACCAGELVVLQNSIGGSIWTTQWQFVPGRNGTIEASAFPARSAIGTFDIIFDNLGEVVLEPGFDAFGVPRTGGLAWINWAKIYMAWSNMFDDDSIVAKPRQNAMSLDQYDPCARGSWPEATRICKNTGFEGPWPDGVPQYFRWSSDVLPPNIFNTNRCRECCKATFGFGEYHNVPNFVRPECRIAASNCEDACLGIAKYNLYALTSNAITAGAGFLPKR